MVLEPLGISAARMVLLPHVEFDCEDGAAASVSHCEDNTAASAPHCEDGAAASMSHCQDGAAASMSYCEDPCRFRLAVEIKG